MAQGITKRHSRRCKSQTGGRCNCSPSYEAGVFAKHEGKKIRKMFASEAEAKAWRAEAQATMARGALRAPTPTTVRHGWDLWKAGAEGGTVRNRSGNPYKPSAIRSYEQSMRLRVLPLLGNTRATEVRRLDVQALVDELLADGHGASTIRCTVLPLRAIFRRALARGEIVVNPCDGLELPASSGRRERVADPTEAEALIAAAPSRDRAVWATALYAGLRRGELRALRAEDVDLAAGVIRVERGWDDKEGEIDLKTAAARRRVPIAVVLRDHLVDQRLTSRREGGELLFGRTPSDPFTPKVLQDRADDAWKDVGLARITPHECRHTFASLMIAAGVNAKALSTFMGHSTIGVTLDLYGHLMPGSEAEAADLLDTYLYVQRERAEEQARAAVA